MEWIQTFQRFQTDHEEQNRKRWNGDPGRHRETALVVLRHAGAPAPARDPDRQCESEAESHRQEEGEDWVLVPTVDTFVPPELTFGVEKSEVEPYGRLLAYLGQRVEGFGEPAVGKDYVVFDHGDVRGVGVV